MRLLKEFFFFVVSETTLILYFQVSENFSNKM